MLCPIVTFIAGLLLFHYKKFTVVYVFGHELTHWIVAKCFLKRTGRFRVHMTNGFVEIYDGNIWITLAPYVIPIYTVAAMGVFGISQIFVYPSPEWATLTFAICASLGYAYHCVLTVFAISQSQSDLKQNGVCFSFAIIVTGNVLLLLLAILLTTGQWRQAYEMTWDMAVWQVETLKSFLGRFLK